MSDVLSDRVTAIIEPSVVDLGYDLVRVALVGGRRRILQIMVERIDRAEMTVEDCATASRAISALLDVEDPIQDAYDLEVSSPGIDRPLVRLDDYARFSGFEAKIELQRPLDGQKRLRGTLLGVGDGDVVTICLKTPGTSKPPGAKTAGDQKDAGFSVPYADIKTAKLVLTDALIKASQAGRL